MRPNIATAIILGLFFYSLLSCGVKGRPTVPEYPPHIGHGLMEPSEPTPKTLLATPTPTPTMPPPLVEPSKTKKNKANKAKKQ